MRHYENGRTDFNPQKNHQKFGYFISQAILHRLFSNATCACLNSCMCIGNGSHQSFILHLYNYCMSHCTGENVEKYQCIFVIHKSISWWEGRIPEDKTDSPSASHSDPRTTAKIGSNKIAPQGQWWDQESARNIWQENEFQISASAFCPCQAVPWEAWKFALGIELFVVAVIVVVV